MSKDNKNEGLIGYAAACCDIYRAGGQDYAEAAMIETGQSLQDFIDAGVDDERDTEILNKVFKQERETAK